MLLDAADGIMVVPRYGLAQGTVESQESGVRNPPQGNLRGICFGVGTACGGPFPVR